MAPPDDSEREQKITGTRKIVALSCLATLLLVFLLNSLCASSWTPQMDDNAEENMNVGLWEACAGRHCTYHFETAVAGSGRSVSKSFLNISTDGKKALVILAVCAAFLWLVVKLVFLAPSVQIASVMSALEQERRMSARLQRQLESQSASSRRAEESAVMASTSADAQAAEMRARNAYLESKLGIAESAAREAKEQREAESEARTALQSRIQELECALESQSASLRRAEESAVMASTSADAQAAEMRARNAYLESKLGIAESAAREAKEQREAESEARTALQSRIQELECAHTRSEETAAAQSVQIASVMSALEQERRLSARHRESQSASLRRAEESTVMASTSAEAQATEMRARIADLESELRGKAEHEAESEARSGALQSCIEELECALESQSASLRRAEESAVMASTSADAQAAEMRARNAYLESKLGIAESAAREAKEQREAESEARTALQSRIQELECAHTRSEEAAAAQSVQIASVMSTLEQERRLSVRVQRQLEVREAEREARSAALQSLIEELYALHAKEEQIVRSGEKARECHTRQLESQSASLRRAEESTVMVSTSAEAQASEKRARIADLESELGKEAKELVQEREAEREARSGALQSRIEKLECALHSKEEQIAASYVAEGLPQAALTATEEPEATEQQPAKAAEASTAKSGGWVCSIVNLLSPRRQPEPLKTTESKQQEKVADVTTTTVTGTRKGAPEAPVSSIGPRSQDEQWSATRLSSIFASPAHKAEGDAVRENPSLIQRIVRSLRRHSGVVVSENDENVEETPTKQLIDKPAEKLPKEVSTPSAPALEKATQRGRSATPNAGPSQQPQKKWRGRPRKAQRGVAGEHGGNPNASWTVRELREYARNTEVQLPSRARKDYVLIAVSRT